MDDFYRQHESWNTFTRALGEFHVAYSWAEKAVTSLLVFLMEGDPNRSLIVLYRMDSRAKCERVRKLAKAFRPEDSTEIAAMADGHEALSAYRNTVAHSCFEWHLTKYRFSLSSFGEEAFPSTPKAVQPKQVRELTAKATEADKLADKIWAYLAERDAVSGLDPSRPSRIVEIKASHKG